jgi:hypothetical protein
MKNTAPPDPGIYENVPFETYLSWPCISNSMLQHARKSLRHLQYALQHGIKEETDAMRFGTLVHAGKLEPLTIQQRYVVRPRFEDRVRKPDGSEYENPRASAAYRAEVAEWKKTIGDKIEVTSVEYQKMLGVVEALANHERSREYLGGPGPTEVSFVWVDLESGLLCKGRCDKWQPEANRISDLKTAFDPWEFETIIARRRYHRQAAMYIDGLATLTGRIHEFCLVAAESSAPFGVRAAPLDEESILAGREEYSELLGRIAVAKQSGDWDEPTDPDAWRLPSWAMPRFELSLGGESVSV